MSYKKSQLFQAFLGFLNIFVVFIKMELTGTTTEKLIERIGFRLVHIHTYQNTQS